MFAAFHNQSPLITMIKIILFENIPFRIFSSQQNLMIQGFHRADQSQRFFHMYFFGFSSLTPEKKFKIQQIAFLILIQVLLSQSVNIFANFQVHYCYDTCEISRVFTGKILA